MQKLVIGMRANQGFTLIEILVVIVILGITVGFALIAFGDFGESKRLLFAAEQLVNTLRLTQQQAILESTSFGLRIDNTSYQILKFQNDWNSLSNRGIYKINYLPPNTLISLKTNSQPIAGAPPILISPAGEMTPFTLNFGTLKEPKIVVLKGERNGNLHFLVVKAQ